MMRISHKTSRFVESVIRETTRIALAHGAVNLGQGYPDFSCPQSLKDAAKAAIDADVNQYAITWGTPAFRTAIAEKVARTYPGWNVDPDTEVCVTCGATEGMLASFLGLLDEGDEVVIFEPWYESYGPHSILTGVNWKLVTLHEPDWSFDEAELRAAFGPRTRAIILNTPHNPTGKMFSLDEMRIVAELCAKWDVMVLSDEIYEHIHYQGPDGHVPPARVPGLEDRTVTINAMSKTYAVTGWRVAWTIAPPTLTEGIRKAHDFLSVCAPAPLQEAGIVAMGFPASYYDGLRVEYQARRDLLCDGLEKAGFGLVRPQGAYYVMADTSQVDPHGDDTAFARRLITEFGVGAVPGSSFFADPVRGRQARKIRFAFPKKLETLQLAVDRLSALRG